MIKAVVTGHSRGLGAAIAHELLGRGIPVLGLSRRRADGAAPVELEQVELDLAQPDAIAAWVAGGALARFASGCERLLLVNNAGTVQPIGPLAGQDPAQVARSVALNVAAPMMLASAAAAAVPNGVELRVLHVSSGAARSPYPGWSVYCATKAALDQHARASALDAGGVRICSLAPGVIDTDMQGEIRSTPAERFPMRARFDELKRSGGLTSPRDCAARLVAYLLAPGFGDSPVADLREVG